LSDVQPKPKVVIPDWAEVKKSRRKHIKRVTRLLMSWADQMDLSVAEREAWIDAGRFHDALRDASVDELRRLAGSSIGEVELLHGPAVATRLERDGETRRNLLDAIRFHSIGSDKWDRVGKALYMADYLEPGRTFDVERRAQLAVSVPTDFDASFRNVVIARMDYARQQSYTVYPESVALLESVR
jgi:HD superfamily phosphohydrolase YqeK